MKFIECYVENFGKLQDFRFKFDEGLTTIHADNGYGKTTLTAFIKCMLYGMEDTKRQDLAENDRKHYMPWQGGRCGGTLTIEEGGRVYRIERSFATKGAEDSFALYDLGAGRPSNDYSSIIGEEILGIDRDGFERTLFLSERRLSGKNDNKSISAKLSDLVGCDGDIGGVDSALKRLEEKRKYYKKTGGRGLIDEITAKISVCSSEITNLERARESAKGLESLIAEQKCEIRGIEERKATLEAERDAMKTKHAKLAIAEQYNDLIEKLKSERARLDELRLAFGGVVPTPTEIDNALYKLRDAEALEAKAMAAGENPELARFEARFAGKTDLSEMERTAALTDDIAELEARRTQMTGTGGEPSELFKKRIPERGELIFVKKALRGSALPLFLTAIVAAALSVLFYLYEPIMAIIPAALGVAVMIVTLALTAGRRRRATDILRSITDEPLRSGVALRVYVDRLLSELEAESTRARARIDADAAREELSRAISEKQGAIISLLERLGAPTYEPYAEIIRQRDDFRRYYGASLGDRESERQRAITDAQRYRREVSEFLSRFAELGDSPFERLKEMLREYNYLLTTTGERARECAQLKEKYGVDTESGSFNQEKLTATEIELRDCESTLEARKRECSALEIRLATEAEKYERIHELRARAAALEEQKAEAEDALDTVQKTKSMLLSAMEAMTSKYLGKTREGFEKYRSLIQGESRRDFLLDTSFTLSVGDVGGTHPEEAYSRGTRDIYALATRLALSDALYTGELPPIILDDPFTALDDRALSEALDLIEKIAKTRQVIYLTCHESRKPR